MKIVLASGNRKKLQELQALFSGLPFDVIPQGHLHVSDVQETGITFVENALIKARHACESTGLPAIADDSGLCVSALSGEPGIYSARYSGGSDEDNIQKVLQNMQTVPAGLRQAFFHCVLVYLSHAKDPAPMICHGLWEGRILEKPVGEAGFGYDPIFYVPEESMSAAQLPMARKNYISHRGQALRQLLMQLKE